MYILTLKVIETLEYFLIKIHGVTGPPHALLH